MLSSGLSGYTLTHTDIGGYTYINPIGVYTPTKRDKDLLIRWLQLSAFGAVFRSHEGNKPDAAVQIYDDEILHYLRRNAYLFKLLAPFRKKLMNNAAKQGLPLMRPMFLEFQNDPKTFDIIDQFMYGSELLVAPILEKNSFEREIYFPRVKY